LRTISQAMDRRHRPRVATAFPVRIWGMDANSRPFMQIATVKNLSELGVFLDGVRSPLKPGCVVDVQYDGTHAEYLVVWVGAQGTRQQGELGLEALPAQPFLWELCLDRTCELTANG
jgi:hypothetical protein